MPAVDCRLPRLPMSATAPIRSDDPRVLLVFTNMPDHDSATALATALVEARLVAALCAGRTLAEFAGAGGVSLTTARTHLVAAFAKTGENRQADLIRRVLGDFALVAAQPPSDGDASQRDV